LWCRYYQIFRPSSYLAQLTDGLGCHFDVWFDLDPHPIRQATKRQLKRGNAFGLTHLWGWEVRTL